MNCNMGIQQTTAQNGDIKNLISRIVYDKRNFTKEQRIVACEQLRETLKTAKDVANIGCDWRSIGDDLLHCIRTRQQLEVKRCVSDCLGVLGCITFSHYNEFIKMMMNEAKIIPERFEDDKALVLKSVAISLNMIGAYSWQSRVKPEDIENIMNEMKNWLEVNDSAAVLLSLLDTCLAVAKYFPAVFKQSFDDIVDFTVGWYIEPEQPDSVLDKCHQMLTELRPYWHDTAPAAITLMKQFLDDANAYIEDIRNNESKPENMLAKTAAILRALKTMLKVMTSPQLSPLITDFAEKISACIVQQSNLLTSVFAMSVGNIFGQMAEILWIAFEINPEHHSLITIMKALDLMLKHPPVSDKAALKIIGYYGKIIDDTAPDAIVEIVNYIVGDEGPMHCIIGRSQQVVQAYGNVLGKLLTPKKLPTLQAAYNCIREDVLKCLDMLKNNETVPYRNSFIIEKKLTIYFTAFYSLGIVKNSLIAMMGLSPSLFTFLMSETPITEKWFIINHPSCHLAILFIVKTHSEKHDNFIANSSLLIDKNSLTLVAESATAKHTTKIFSTVAKLLLLDDFFWSDTRNLLIDWIYDMFFALSPDILQRILDKSETIELRIALLDSFVRHSLPKKTPLESKNSAASTSRRVRHFTLLRRLAVFNLIQNGGPKMIAKFVRRIFKHCHLGCQEKIIGLWQATPPALFISNGLTEYAQDLMEFGQQKIPESLFTAEHFKIIADFLLNSTVPTYCFNNIDDGYWMSDTATIMYTDAMGDTNANTDCISKWRWIIGQMAQFCVDNRLKTPLGKPLDTFLALENEIRRLASSAISRKPLPVNKDTKDEMVSKTVRGRRAIAEDDDEGEGEAEREPRQLTNPEQWWRVRLLLDTVEMLDKMMNYACDGAIFQLSTVSQVSQQFFTTNQASCMNWLSRMYLPMMAVAYTNGNYAQVVRLGGCFLKDIEKRIMEKGKKDSTEEKGGIDSIAHTCVTWMVKALIDLGRPQAIMGLYAWVEKIYGKPYDWIKYAAEMAAGRIEIALHGFEDCLRDENLSENVQKTLRQLIIMGLEVLRNPNEIEAFWRQLYGTMNSESDDVPEGFEEIAWKRMKSLTTFENQFKNEAAQSVSWDIRSDLANIELKLIDIVTRDRSKDVKENKYDVVDLTRQLGENAKLLMLADTSLQAHTNASALHLLATSVKDSRKPNHKQLAGANLIDPSFLFEWKNGSPIQRLTIAEQLSTWLRHTQTRESGGSSSLRVIANEPAYYLEVARLARKTRNYRLAESHIKSHFTKRLPSANNYQQSIFQGLQGSWTNGATDKENNLLGPNGISMPMMHHPRVYNTEYLASSYGASKIMWDIRNIADTDRARVFVQGRSFSLLMNAVADEVDRLLFKSNLMFNGTPTVPPEALSSVISQQLNQAAPEDLLMVSMGSSKANIRQQQQHRNNTLSKAIIQLARWLQMEPNLLPVAMNYSMRIVFHMFGVEQLRLPPFGPSDVINEFTGSLLSTSCKLSPKLAKAHLELGNWAFKAVTANGGEIRQLFTNEEILSTKSKIRNVCPSVEDSVIESLVQKIQQVSTFADVLPSCKAIAKNSINEQGYDLLFGLKGIIQDIWRAANARHITLCTCAARSYFTYIAVGGYETEKGIVGTVMATLRILHLLLKHYDELHHLILSEMLQTNELIWKDILPQLFARLNHPVQAVRDTLCKILERIAESAPHAVCYPAIVGATQPIVVHSGDEDNDEAAKNDFVEVIDEEKKKQAEQDRSLMFECCQRIVQKMQSFYPELVSDVTKFVKELQRIDMLHEERWFFVLNNLDHEMNRRIVQIESETMKTLMSTHLSDNEKKKIVQEKTFIFTSLIYRIVEELYRKTCSCAPLTTNEKQFQDTYYTPITEALKTLLKNKHEPRKAWAPFEQLLTQLNQRANRRSLVSLQMADISRHLAALNHSHIPLPGQEHKNFSEVVMLERISKQTVILPTKTRPRKIAFHGSDGRDYPFLFKGQEDLHLDERVMQLLRICNLMLTAKQTDWPSYRAENYSVTPLGSRSGLIEWVEGATPMFQVYRKWQLRQVERNMLNKTGNETERPSELFFKKLRLALQANNIPKESIVDRRKWPPPILKNVVKELIDETPQNLLSRELWLRAGSSDAWFRVTERFARSTAVMSMLGSILGLGDRHLDNVLVNFETGHVVHVDYNVCFDKGRNLRVPETVPFRLTGNIIRALGPTEVEGTFRHSCENVLTKLRAGKEILLTMLDAFVYDPLVDWAAAQDDLGSKSTIGMATMIAVYGADVHPENPQKMARSLFTLRIKELSTAWIANRDRMQHALSSVADILEKLCTNTTKNTENRNLRLKEGVASSRLEMEKLFAGRDLKNAITDHHSLMHDMRPLLRTFAHKNQAFAKYLKEYKELFSDPLVKGHKLLDEAGNDFRECIGLFRSVISEIPRIYENLLTLEKAIAGMDSAQDERNSRFQDQREGYEEQQKQNLHGKHVSKRVRMKLDGLIETSETDNKNDISAARKQLTPEEQVDFLIQQATDISNLALMYEGWTAWV